jgi:methionyl-tRNA synthetase
MVEPFIPGTSERILAFLGLTKVDWNDLGKFSGISAIGKPEILFAKLEDDTITALRERFSGSQKEREERDKEKLAMENGKDHGKSTDKTSEEAVKSISERFPSEVDLRVAKIVGIERHPEADKLYIENIDLGGEERTIVSGLVPYYNEEELLGHNIILVYNLKPAKLRGVKSQGMLLAADDPSAPEGERIVEVLFADWAEPGSRVLLEGSEASPEAEPKRISVDTFFSMPIGVKDGSVLVDGKTLTVDGRPLITAKVKNGSVG